MQRARGRPPSRRRPQPISELTQRAEDPDRDLAAVGDQNLRERHGRILSQQVTLPPISSRSRAPLSVPVVVVLCTSGTSRATTTGRRRVFIAAMTTDWLRRADRAARGDTSSLGTLLDPDRRQAARALGAHHAHRPGASSPPGWSSAIVAREFLITGCASPRSSAASCIAARDLGKLKTWSQAIAAAARAASRRQAPGRDTRRRGGRCSSPLVLTWVSGLDYARVAPLSSASAPSRRSPSAAARQRLRAPAGSGERQRARQGSRDARRARSAPA